MRPVGRKKCLSVVYTYLSSPTPAALDGLVWPVVLVTNSNPQPASRNRNPFHSTRSKRDRGCNYLCVVVSPIAVSSSSRMSLSLAPIVHCLSSSQVKPGDSKPQVSELPATVDFVFDEHENIAGFEVAFWKGDERTRTLFRGESGSYSRVCMPSPLCRPCEGNQEHLEYRWLVRVKTCELE